MGEKQSAKIGLAFGMILIFIPEPATTLLGLGIVGFSAQRMGWL